MDRARWGSTVLAAGVALLSVCPGASAEVTESAGVLWAWPQRPIVRMVVGNIGRLLTLRSEIKLTDSQRHDIEGILQTHRQAMVKSAKRLVAARRALRNAVLTEGSHESAIRAAAAEFGQSLGGAAVLASQVSKEVRGTLTPGQIEQIRQTRASVEASVDAFLQAAGEQ